MSELKAFDASINSMPQPSSLLSSKTSESAWIAPSTPAFSPQANWSVEHVSSRSIFVNSATLLQIILRRHSPMPIGHTPGHSSSAINLPETSACTFDHGKIWLHIFVARVATSSLMCELWVPWRFETVCQCSESVPEAPELPCKERVVFSMEPELIITFSKSCKTGTCNREERSDLCGSGCFDFKVYKTVTLFLTSCIGSSTPPLALSESHRLSLLT